MTVVGFAAGPAPTALSPRQATALCAVALAICLPFLELLPPGAGTTVAYSVQTLTGLAGLTVFAVRARRGPAALAPPRWILSTGIAVGVVSGVLAVAMVAVVGGRSPTPDAVDAIGLAMTPLFALALLRYPVDPLHPGSAVRSLLDATTAAVALWLVFMLVVLPGHPPVSADLAARLTLLAYPAGDMFLVGLVLSVLPRVAACCRQEVGLLALGVGVLLASDVAFFVGTSDGTYRPDSWVGLLSELAFLLMILAAVLRPERSRRAPSRAFEALLLLPLLAAGGTALTVLTDGGSLIGGSLAAALALGLLLVLRHVVLLRDQSRLTGRLRALASTDALTGLGNLGEARRLLNDCYAGPRPRAAQVVLVDLDGFKAVNDTHGHAVGDALLVEVARRLRACLREGDAAARLGGDEFLLLVRGDSVVDVASRVVATLHEPVELDGRSVAIGASVGSCSTTEASSADEALRCADSAMYRAKREGRGRHRCFTEQPA